MTLLDRFDKYGISRHANVREIRRALAIAQAVDEWPLTLDGPRAQALRRADELLEGGR